MSKVVMGNSSYYGFLSEPHGVSARWKETGQTHVVVLSRALMLNHLEPHLSKAKPLLLIMPISIMVYAFTLKWDKIVIRPI